MPYSKKHKQESREQILKSAVFLFCAKGYDKVSIDDLMQDAKLTRGAFYAHFSSKSDVYMKAIMAAAENTDIIINAPKNLDSADLLSYFLGAYLTPEHVKQEISPCPLAFLATDVANKEPKVKKTYTAVFEGIVKMIRKNLPDGHDEEKRLQTAYAISALAIGSVAIGRALDNEEMLSQLLESSHKIAISLTQCDL